MKDLILGIVCAALTAGAFVAFAEWRMRKHAKKATPTGEAKGGEG